MWTRLNIRNRVLFAAALAFVALGVAQYFVQRNMLLPHFESLERDHARATVERLHQVLARELDVVALSARDWANWIEVYNYVLAPNDEFLRVNVNAKALQDIHVDAIAIIDLHGNFVWAGAYDRATGEPVRVGLFAAGALAPADPLRRTLGTAGQASGITMTDRGPMIVAISPILNGTGSGQPAGALLLARFLSAKELAEAAQIAPDKVSLVPIGGSAPGAVAGEASTLVQNAHTLRAGERLTDLAGQPLLMLTATLPRTISDNALTTILIASALLVALAGGALAIFLTYLNGAVFRPLAEITNHAAEIGASDDLGKRLARGGDDELAELARTFDRMVERLARTRSDLIDKSFSAGIAEMASGALHNLGNALTPLSVRVTGLEETLRRAPAEDMELVAAELSVPSTDAARQADLTEFVRLAGLELARVVSCARTDAEAAARQLQGIQRILTDQVRKSRAGAVLEPVSPAVLVRQSQELVAEAVRQRLEVEIGPELQALGSLRLPATMLRQVFQNLIVNAAEACPHYPARKGRLTISATVRDEGERQLLVCRFTDDGEGIDPVALPRLFERQFSTKSKDTNSGIGLHWCANALLAAGGGITATSAGAGHGACFEVTVPLPSAQATSAARAA